MNGFVTLFLLAVAVERVVELSVSRRHERALVARGFSVAVEPAFAVMVAVHAATLVGAWGEGTWAPWRSDVRIVAGILFTGSTLLRWWVIRTLGERWTVRVVAGPRLALTTAGPYRYLRHPNYLAVLFEVPAVALMCGAWRTALVCGIANGFVLRARIRLEERTLAAYVPYREEFRGRRALIPRRGLSR